MSKFWDNQWVQGGIGLAAGMSPVTSNIYAGLKSANTANEQDKLIEDATNENEAWYNKTSNQDYFDTNVGSSVLTRFSDQLKESNKKVENQAVVSGATTESVLAGKTANQENYNSALNQLASQGTARQDQARSRFMSQSGQLLQSKMGLLDSDLESANNLSQNSGDMMDSAMQILPFLI